MVEFNSPTKFFACRWREINFGVFLGKLIKDNGFRWFDIKVAVAFGAVESMENSVP